MDTQDVVVCAPDQNSFRLRPLPTAPEKKGLPKAAVSIGDVAVSVEGEAAGLPVGQLANRAMVRVRIPLGRGKKRSRP